jgi:hypothetical protein
MADSERPSPFTIPEPAFKFVEGLPSEPRPSRSMTVGGLIHDLTVFADLYERASADIDREEGFTKTWYIGNRDANAGAMQRDYRATVAIDRVRAYVLANYGADLTIGMARRLLGDLIRTCGLAVDAAEALPLEEAMDKLDGVESRRNDASFIIERLLAGPDDVELLPRDLALLEAHLQQPVSFATIQQEKKATGHFPTEAARSKLKLIRDFNRGLQGQHHAEDVEKPDASAPAVATDPIPKRSTERGEGRLKLIAALTKHHQYADGGCLNLEPIGNNELARLAEVGTATATRFFGTWFDGHSRYCGICRRNTSKLVDTIKAMRGEFVPSREPNYGAVPPADDERD